MLITVNRWAPPLGLLTATLFVGGCGSAKSSSPASTTALASATSALTVSREKITSTSSASSHPRTSSVAPTPGSTPGASGGSTQARIPATFTIRRGRLSPPTISFPASIAVELTVVSGDEREHEVFVRTPTPHRLTAPAGGRAALVVAPLRAGRYKIEVDGVARGELFAGAGPGP